VVDWLEQEAQTAKQQQDRPSLLRAYRDRALILLGFWRGFRSDELCRLQIEHVQAHAGGGITLYLPRSKGDRDNLGRAYQTPALLRLCPVRAYHGLGQRARRWCDGSAYFAVSTAGAISRKEELHADSVIPLLQSSIWSAPVSPLDKLTPATHRRRGFASWTHAKRLGSEVVDGLRRLGGT
jgi:hypothetical protein